VPVFNDKPCLELVLGTRNVRHLRRMGFPFMGSSFAVTWRTRPSRLRQARAFAKRVLCRLPEAGRRLRLSHVAETQCMVKPP